VKSDFSRLTQQYYDVEYTAADNPLGIATSLVQFCNLANILFTRNFNKKITL